MPQIISGPTRLDAHLDGQAVVFPIVGAIHLWQAVGHLIGVNLVRLRGAGGETSERRHVALGPPPLGNKFSVEALPLDLQMYSKWGIRVKKGLC